MTKRLYFPDKHALVTWLQRTKAGRSLVAQAAVEIIEEWRPQLLCFCDFEGRVEMIGSDGLRIAFVDVFNLDYSGPLTAMAADEYAALKTPQAYRWLLQASVQSPRERRSRKVIHMVRHGTRQTVEEAVKRQWQQGWLTAPPPEKSEILF